MAEAGGRGGRLHFVLGGMRSGKSRFAERLVEASGLEPVYLATGQAFDEGMRARIAEHRARRVASPTGGPWRTVEVPLDLAEAIGGEAGAGRALLLDCLTLWVTNLMLAERDVDAEADRLVASLRARPPGLLVLVSNEVGLSVVPANDMARRFADHSGRLHQMVAEVCDEVTLVAAGLPLRLKG